ncbi:hypothetical protein NE857_33225 [Nocardiopsis exhalans]|uniref:PH domain-containing protein n=1 Tax=Nocardiopsis exhalans TaxID=163604 RepID=A0ABY5D7Q1_9ACTN|nr:hypothetical protein [Nocardiopsis exhalans]USY20032.1 hypothetical protein NE857_33225 [Nocardiopsis exhalans]
MWGCGAVVVILMLGMTLMMAATAEDGEAFAHVIAVLAASLTIGFFLIRGIPRVTTEQGISVDGRGISFTQKPKWWFKGRTLNLPWHELVTARGAGPTGSPQASDTPGDSASLVRVLSFYLRRTPPKELAPTWITHVAEGADSPDRDDYSPLARLHFTATPEQYQRLIGAIRSWRPDLAEAPLPTHASQPGAPAGPGFPGGPGSHGPQVGQLHGHTQAAHPRAAHPQLTADTRFELRASKRSDWSAKMFFTLLAIVIMGAPITVLLSTWSASDGLTTLLPMAMPGVIVLAALVYAWFLVVSLPHYWTRQGIQLDQYGISTYRDRMWWFRGDRSHVSWQDVHHIDSHERRRRKRPTLTLVEFHLHRTDHEMRLPVWARLLMAGESKWSFTASSRPVLLFHLENSASPRQLLRHLRQTRPDLFREQVAERAVREHDARQRQAWHAEQQGYAPRRSAYSTNAPTEWVNLRPRRLGAWAIGAAILLYFWVIMAGFLSMLFTEGAVGESIGGFVVMPLVTIPLSIWSLRAMPRCFTHQGVSVDGAGITLVQDPFLWFEGRTAHLPWSGIRMIREDRVGSGSERLMKVFMHHPDALSAVPTWCEFNNRAINEPPASAHEPLTLAVVKTPPKHRIRLLRAAAAARPDLVVTV